MPLITVRVPKDYHQQSVTQLIAFCDAAHELLRHYLGIPNPQDKEIRIISDDKLVGRPEVTISFTIGPHEYDDYDPPSFFPTPEQIAQAANEIQTLASRYGISEHITIDEWSETTFHPCEGNPITRPSLATLEAVKAHPPTNPVLHLFLAPEIASAPSYSGTKEGGRFSVENEQYLSAMNQVTDIFTEILGLTDRPVIVVSVTDYADIGVAFELDCDVDLEYPISPEVRKFLAQTAERVFRDLNLISGKDGEVWLRQGKPTRYEFPQQN